MKTQSKAGSGVNLGRTRAKLADKEAQLAVTPDKPRYGSYYLYGSHTPGANAQSANTGLFSCTA